MIGITNGAFIALIALGYTLVYGIIELINFAHGDLFMLGTFVCLSTLTLLGFSTEVGTTGTPWFALLLAMLAAMIFCGLLNVLAGAASLMYGLYNNNTVFTLGFTAGLKAFTAAVLGGIGNVNGAALGGFVLGLLSALTVTYAGGQWENVGVFSLLVIILVFKPTGLLGQETGEKA